MCWKSITKATPSNPIVSLCWCGTQVREHLVYNSFVLNLGFCVDIRFSLVYEFGISIKAECTGWGTCTRRRISLLFEIIFVVSTPELLPNLNIIHALRKKQVQTWNSFCKSDIFSYKRYVNFVVWVSSVILE